VVLLVLLVVVVAAPEFQELVRQHLNQLMVAVVVEMVFYQLLMEPRIIMVEVEVEVVIAPQLMLHQLPMVEMVEMVVVELVDALVLLLIHYQQEVVQVEMLEVLLFLGEKIVEEMEVYPPVVAAALQIEPSFLEATVVLVSSSSLTHPKTPLLVV
jgi:hypothetical protein